jgi:hypothetical protein
MLRYIVPVCASLLVLWLVSERSRICAQPGAEPPRVAPAAPAALAPREAKGYGLTVDDAKRNALKRAVEDVAAFLHRQDLTAWQPDERYVEQYLIDGPGRADADVRAIDANDVKAEDGAIPEVVSKVWVLPFKQTNWDQVTRDARVHERQLLSGKFLLVACVLLVAGLGYVRFDEWLQRRGGWLRAGGVAALAVLAAVSVGWWLG